MFRHAIFALVLVGAAFAGGGRDQRPRAWPGSSGTFAGASIIVDGDGSGRTSPG